MGARSRVRQVLWWVRVLFWLCLCLWPGVLFAEDKSVASDIKHMRLTVDTFFVLMSAFMVFFMQAGFGMVEAGLVRAKNASNILMKNMMDFCLASLGFFFFGYALMFGGTGAFFGTQGWFLVGAKTPAGVGVPLYAFWLFQAAFCGAAATIVAGGVAERMKFSAYLVYSFLISSVVYPIVGHWVWGGGWLSTMGFYDFAGSGVVHATGGFSALVGAVLLGPRLGKYNLDGSANFIGGHNIPLVSLGVFILWFGWFGFNAGSALSLQDPVGIATIAINTNMAAASGALAVMVGAWLRFGKPELSLTLNGALAGLVAITAPCSVVTPGAAIYIGTVAGILCLYGVLWLDARQIDDPVGAFPVHGLNGVWGCIAVGLWGQNVVVGKGKLSGLFYGGGWKLLGTQALGIFAIVSFVVIAMWLVFKVIDVLIGLRVSQKHELGGLDLNEHGMESYSGFQIFTTE